MIRVAKIGKDGNVTETGLSINIPENRYPESIRHFIVLDKLENIYRIKSLPALYGMKKGLYMICGKDRVRVAAKASPKNVKNLVAELRCSSMYKLFYVAPEVNRI